MPATHVDRTCSTMKRVRCAQPDESGSGVLSAIRLCPRAGGRLPSPRSGSLRLGRKRECCFRRGARLVGGPRDLFRKAIEQLLILLRRISLCRATREFSNVQVGALARRESWDPWDREASPARARSLPGPRALNDNWAVYGSKLLLWRRGAPTLRSGQLRLSRISSRRTPRPLAAKPGLGGLNNDKKTIMATPNIRWRRRGAIGRHCGRGRRGPRIQCQHQRVPIYLPVQHHRRQRPDGGVTRAGSAVPPRVIPSDVCP